MAGRAQRLTQILEMTTTRLQELGMNNSEVANSTSAIQKHIQRSMESVENSTNRQQNGNDPLMTALGRALQNNRVIRRYFGDGRQMIEFSSSMLAEVESQFAVDEG